MNVLVFGQLKEIIGDSQVSVPLFNTTEDLTIYLNKTYPGIAQIKYLMAVDKEVIQTKTALTANNTIALLPPYAGG